MGRFKLPMTTRSIHLGFPRRMQWSYPLVMALWANEWISCKNPPSQPSNSPPPALFDNPLPSTPSSLSTLKRIQSGLNSLVDSPIDEWAAAHHPLRRISHDYLTLRLIDFVLNLHSIDRFLAIANSLRDDTHCLSFIHGRLKTILIFTTFLVLVTKLKI